MAPTSGRLIFSSLSARMAGSLFDLITTRTRCPKLRSPSRLVEGHQRHRDLSLFARQPMLGWLGVVVLHDQKRYGFCLVVLWGKVAVHQDFCHPRSRHGPCGAAGCRGVRHTRRTNGMAHGSLHAWLDQQRLDHAGLVTVSLCAPPLPPLPRFPPTHWLVQGDCVRARIPDLALHFVLLLDATCSSSLTRHRTCMDATLTPSGPEKKKGARAAIHIRKT